LSFGGLGGGSGSGEIRYVISVDDQQAIQKLQGVSQQFQQMGQASGQTAQQLQALPQALDQSTASAGKFSQANADMAAELQATDIGAKQAVQSTQSFGSVMKQNIGTIISMASGILGLVSNYTSLQRTQLQINKLEVTEANQRRQLGVLTRQHAAAVEKYGATSQKALDIEAKIDILQARHTNTLDQLNIRQEQQTQAQLSFGISVIQTGASIVQMVGQLKTYKGATDAASAATKGLTMSMRALKIATVIGAVLVGIEVAAQAIANNWGNIQQKLDELYNWAVKVVPALKPVIDAIWTVGQAITALFTGDFDALNKMFSGAPKTIDPATTSMGEFGEATTEAGKAANDAQQAYTEFLDTAVKGIVEISKGKKGEKNDWLKMVGIKGDEKEKMRDVLDAVEDGTKEMDQAAAKLNALEGFSILEKLGFDIPEDVKKDILNTMDSDFRDIIEGKNDPFEKVANIIKENTPKGQDAVNKAIADFFAKNPGLLAALKHFNPELASAVEAMIAKVDLSPAKQTVEEKFKGIFNPQDIGQGIKDNLSDIDWQNIMNIPGNQPGSTNYEEKTGPGGHKYFKSKDTSLFNKGEDKTGIQKWIDDTIATIKAGFSPEKMKGVGEGIAKAIFVTGPEIATTIGKWFTDTFTLTNFSSALKQVQNVLTSVGEVAFQMILGLGAAGAGFAAIALPIIIKWFQDTFTLENFSAALSGIEKVLMAVGQVAFELIGKGWTALKDVGKTIGEWFASVFTLDNFATALGVVEKALMAVGQVAFELIGKGWTALKDAEKTIGEWFASVFTVKNLVAALGALKDIFGQVADGIMYLIGLGFTAMKNVDLSAAAQKIVDGIITGINAIKDLGSQIWAAITGSMTKEDVDLSVGKVTINPDGTVTVTIPKTPEVVGPKPGTKTEGLEIPYDGIVTLIASTVSVDTRSSKFVSKMDELAKKNFRGQNPGGSDITVPVPSADIQPGIVNVQLAGVPTGDLGLGDLVLNGGMGSGAVNFGGNNAHRGAGSGSGTDSINIPVSTAVITPSTVDIDLGDAALNATIFLQVLQQAINSLAKFGTRNLVALGKAAKTNLNSVANYASGATEFVQTLQTAVNSMVKFGVKNLVALAKAAKTDFNTVANFASGATKAIQELQKAIDSMVKFGLKNIAALAKASKTNFNTVANYANGATDSVNKLQDAIDNLKSKSITITVNATGNGLKFLGSGGTISFAQGGTIKSAAQGFTTNGPQLLMVGDNPGGHETVAVVPHNNPWPTLGLLEQQFGKGGGGSTVNQVINLKISGNDIINERNLTKRIKITVGENRDKFGG